MVLDHVSYDAGLIVESASALNTKLLCHRDLHTFDIVAIPKRLEKRVRESEVEHVLNGPLSKVMVNTEYRFLGKSAGQDSIQFLSRNEVRSKRFFDDDAGTCSPAGFFELFHDRPEHRRWNCEIE